MTIHHPCGCVSTNEPDGGWRVVTSCPDHEAKGGSQ